MIADLPFPLLVIKQGPPVFLFVGYLSASDEKSSDNRGNENSDKQAVHAVYFPGSRGSLSFV
jgi:hypothetical protein